jgi:RES domain-containing protein
MRVYRIADGRYPVMDGEGARVAGGPWNSPGHALVYTCETFAGSMLEVLIHMNRLKLPKNRVYVEIHIEDRMISRILAEGLPGWDTEDQIVSRAFGDKWLRDRRSLGLLVPNMATQGVERNLLINPHHPEFSQLAVTGPVDVHWDARLFHDSGTQSFAEFGNLPVAALIGPADAVVPAEPVVVEERPQNS